VLDEVRRHFNSILRRAGDGLPAYRDLAVEEDHHDLRLAFRARFHNREPYYWRISRDLLIEDGAYQCGRFDNAAFFNECRRIWSELYENEGMRRELAPRRERMVELARRGAPPDVMMEAQRELEDFVEHLRRHHVYRNLPMVAVDLGRLTEIDITPGAVNFVGTEELQSFQSRAYRHFQSEMQQQIYDAFVMPAHFFGADVGDAKANKRGIQLLTSWLTPEQRKTFAKHGHFDVVGSASKKLYRIKQGRQQNVFELDWNNREICGWCFLPQGGLVAGDVMLAQKIALETDERAVLKIANRFADRRPNEYHPERVRGPRAMPAWSDPI
jgi:hypothetical protein